MKSKPKKSSKLKKTKSKKSVKKPKTQSKSKTPIKKQPVDEKVQKELNEINKLFLTIGFYPVAINQEKKDATRKKILATYNKGKQYMQQTILYLIYENLTQYSEYKNPMNFNFYKSLKPDEAPGKLKLSVYKTMFNYHTSLEGSLDLISMLGELGDLASAKVLTHLFNYYSGKENVRFQVFRNCVINALGECKSTYALSSLLNYANLIESEKTFQRIVSNLMKWDEKLNSLKLPKGEKDKLKESLKEFLMVGGSEGHSYVR